MRLAVRWGWVLLAAMAGCTVHQSDGPPALTGPSTYAQSLSITATPDLLTQDGLSRSAINVRAFDANGRPLGAIPVRLDITVNGTLVDYGSLSTKNLVTSTDGRATAVYTAPPPAPPTAPTSSTISVQATIVGTDGPGSVPFSTLIRLVAPGVILPPAETPTAVFSFSPTSPAANTPVQFNASASCGGPLPSAGAPCQSASQIASYSWNFGDGASGAGQVASHVFATAGAFNVTLTVTNDRGVSASTTQSVAVGAPTLPTAAFDFSPRTPRPGDEISFNASGSVAGAGHMIVSYHWDFGDGDDAVGQIARHKYTTANTYAVTLTVTDEVGQTKSLTQNVAVDAGLPKANFVFSPTTPKPGDPVFFNGAISVAGPGHRIVSYLWSFGDGAMANDAAPTHSYSTANTYNVTLTVTDELGQSNTSPPQSVKVQ